MATLLPLIGWSSWGLQKQRGLQQVLNQLLCSEAGAAKPSYAHHHLGGLLPTGSLERRPHDLQTLIPQALKALDARGEELVSSAGILLIPQIQLGSSVSFGGLVGPGEAQDLAEEELFSRIDHLGLHLVPGGEVLEAQLFSEVRSAEGAPNAIVHDHLAAKRVVRIPVILSPIGTDTVSQLSESPGGAIMLAAHVAKVKFRHGCLLRQPLGPRKLLLLTADSDHLAEAHELVEALPVLL